jgi:amino acid adenylation domain-containing protein
MAADRDVAGATERLYPVSFAQQRLWFLDELEPGNPAYNLPRVVRIQGTLNVSALAGAIQALVSRHDGLRTVFRSIEGEPRQVILARMQVDLPILDLSHLSSDARKQEALRLAGEEGRRPFDLTSGPLLRGTLIRLGPREHILVLVMHHIITDGWSMSIFFRELAEFYRASVDARAPELPELTARYSDFAQWQRESVSGEVLRGLVEYWKKELHGAETILDLPTDHSRPLIHTGHGAREHFFIDQHVAEKLKRLGQSQNATLFMTLLAAFQTLLWRYTLQATVLVGTPVAGRNEVELEGLVGFFVNTLILRADFSDDPTFRELLKRIRSTALEAYAHQDAPFEKLVEELNPERTLSRTPLFQAMLVLQNAPKQTLELQDLVLEELDFESGIAMFDLTLEVVELDGLHCTFEYSSDLFDRTTIRRLIGHFETLIHGFIRNPEARVSALPLLTGQERQQILVDWNNTAAAYANDLCIHTAFEQQAARTPEAEAFRYQDHHLTYGQLNERANRLAHYLVGQGVAPGSLVGISVERSLEMAIGLLGILKAGAAYVPLDPSLPAQRLAVMLEDSRVRTIVTQHAVRDSLLEHGAQLLFLDADKAGIDAQSQMNPSVPRSSEDLAYVIYTSGSTGTPKGVEGTHRASMNRFEWMWKTYPFGPGETCCQKTALSFVDSIWEIFGPLLGGVRNVIIPEQVLLETEQFVQLLAKYEVSRIVLVPSLLRVLLDQYPDLAARLPILTLWSASGEALTADLARSFIRALPRATLLNIYGSSEVAADVTWHEVREKDTTSCVPIGKPISNTQIYILDRYLNPVPAGVRGEIHVGGDCLSRGYWNRPEATAERFIRNPFGTSTRLYKTGDLGRFLPDGAVEYLGRADNQVKIRGFRIELGEIESVLRSHPSVREAVVTVQGEQQKLLAYVVAADGQESLPAELRLFVGSKLPQYMAPSTYVVLEAMPVLPSGKINRNALPSAELVRPFSDRTYVAPRNDIEETLAGIWREVLKLDQVGIEDNFFELGGHSLLAVQVISRIRKAFDVEVSIMAIFERLVIAGLAEEVARAKAAGTKARRPVLTGRMPTESKEALLAQLDQLSPEEIHALLDQVMTKKTSEQAGKVQRGDRTVPKSRF